MKTRSFYPVLLVVFAIGSVVSQNAEELPINVETDNQFPPEYSELDGRNEGSETTTADYTQFTTGSTIADVSASTSTNEETVESTEPTPASSVTDGAVTTSINDDGAVTSSSINDNENVNYSEDDETTAAETTQTTSESTIPDIAAPLLTTDIEQLNDKGSKTTTLELSEATSGPTIANTVASTLTTNSEVSETTAAETTQTTSDVVAPTLITNDEQDTTNEGSGTTATESPKLASGSTIEDVAAPALANDNEQVTNNEGAQTTAAEPTQTTSGSTITDVSVPTTITKDDQDTTNKGSETTVVEPSELTSGFATTDVAAPTPTLITKDEQKTTNEGSKTTVAQTLTTKDDVTNNAVSENTVIASMATEVSTCPKPCVCVTEGDSSNYIIDCSGYGLTDLPTPIDPRTTTLKLNDNKLTVIPKAISELKNLKVLNANDNLITELESGSVSELPQLLSLKLANNRLIEYPKELENSLLANTLEELDLAGNEIKVTPDFFLNYKALRTVTLPEVTPDLQSELCKSLQETVTICAKSCNENSFKCSDASFHIKDDGTLPGMIPFINEIVTSDTVPNLDASGTTINSEIEKTDNIAPVFEAPETPSIPAIKQTSDNLPVPEISSNSNSRRKESSQMIPESQLPETSPGSKDNLPVSEFSLRTAVNNAPQEKVALQNIVIDAPKASTYNESDVKVGAKTTDTKGGGGVDKSVIAVVVAGMVIVIAVITVKKNWSSIRKRFSSAPRPNDRSGHANGTTPEEVPLQDKSPV